MRRTRIVAAALAAFGLCSVVERGLAEERVRGLNVIETPDAPFGSDDARRSLEAMRRLGANAMAVTPFFWQSGPNAAGLTRGSDLDDSRLRLAVREGRRLGLAVMVKPHVWVPQTWAGEVVMTSEADWAAWFASYWAEMARIADIAREEGAQMLSLGVELRKTTHRPEWRRIIAAIRARFPGTLIYFAHGADEAEKVPFWRDLDLVGMTLYPALGAADAPQDWRASMRKEAERADRLAEKEGKKVMIGEIGLRSAADATLKPWESAEEREAEADDGLQARVMAAWLDVLERPSVAGVLVWRWFTDPKRGGPKDTDFTIQGKLAEGALFCRWAGGC